MKSPLFQKQGLDAFLEQLNDPATTNPDDRTDKEFEHPYGSKGTEPESVKYGAAPAPALVSPQLKMWDLVQAAGGPLRVKNQYRTAEEAVRHLSTLQNQHIEKLRAKFPGVIPVSPEEISTWAARTYAQKQGAAPGQAIDPNSAEGINIILQYIMDHRTATTQEVARALGISHEATYGGDRRNLSD